MANCMWNDKPEAHKYHLVNWDTVSMLKEYGGLGDPNLRDLNFCLLAYWIKRYNLDENKLWRHIINMVLRDQISFVVILRVVLAFLKE